MANLNNIIGKMFSLYEVTLSLSPHPPYSLQHYTVIYIIY